MSKSVRETDDGLPILSKDTAVADTTGDGLPILKKKDGTGSLAHSDSSQNQGKTEPSENTSASDPKQVTVNYKNNSLTPKNIGEQPLGPFPGPTPDQLSHGINNKGKNLSNWGNAPSDAYITSLVNQHQEIQKKISDLGNIPTKVKGEEVDVPIEYRTEMNDLQKQEQYLRTEIQKTYDARKQKIVPDLIDHLKKDVDVSDWTDAYNKPDKDLLGMKIPSPLQWNPQTHKLTEKSVEWVAKHVDDQMNKKGDAATNAQVSGDLDKKERTYQDLTKSVVDYLNTVPLQKAQKDFTEKYADKNPKIKDAFDASEQINSHFSKENVDELNAKVNIDRDKSIMATQHKYFGTGGVAFQNKDFVDIQNKYAELVGQGKMSDEVARKQIDLELKQNPALKKINDNYQDEIRKIHEKTQKDFEGYMITGLKGEKPKLTIYKDGSTGLAGMSEDQYKNMMEGYQEGLDGVAKKMGLESEAATMKFANEKAKNLGAFWGSAGASVSALSSAMSKFVFNKTQWGAKNVQYYEAGEIASPSVEQSRVAASWNWKGLESLKDPNFWLSKVGSMVPVIAGGSAIGLATDGAGMPEYIGWLANAGLFTAQSGLSTYNQMLNTRDAQGNLLTESDASHYMASQMEKDFLPNFLMMAVTSGTILKAKNIVKPTIGGAIKKGLFGTAAAQPFFTWQGYNEYATSQEAQGKKADFWDYMQSKDFKDNLINGMVVGGGLSLLHAPGTYMKSVDHWTNMLHTSEGEFRNLIPQNYALGMEMAGNGNYLRDALKMHVFNVDQEGLNEQGKRQLVDLKNTLMYSVNLDKNIRIGNLDPKNVTDLYQAHNLSLADQHDYLSDQAAKEGNKSLSDIYKDKAKDYREQAKAAANGEAKYHYLVNGEGHPIFMSDKSFQTLEQEGTIAKWMKEGVVESVHKSDDPEFAQKYKDFVTAKEEAKVEGSDIMDHAKGLIEENKENLGVMYGVAKEDPEQFYKAVADQAFGRNADGSESNLPNADKAARDQYGSDIVDLAKVMYPEVVEDKNKMYSESEGEKEDGGYKPQIRDDYFAKADFFTSEEKEKFATLDEAGQDKMIDEKRSELKEKSGISINYPGELKPPNVIPPVEKGPSKITVIKPGELKPPNVVEPISSPKTENDESESEKLQEQDALGDGAGRPPSPPPIPEPRIPKESPKEEFTSVRKEKQKEIKGAKALFKRQKRIQWTDIYDSALSHVQDMYPNKSLYEASKSRVNEFVSKLDSGVLFNPTSEDIAVFNYLKDETKRRMNEIPGWDSNDSIQRMAAVAEFTVLQNDLYNIVKVNNPGGEAGRAFGLLQSEIAQDPDYGLQIRRMELLGHKAGEKLTQDDLDFTAENWEKERALMKQENDLKQKGMQENFDKEIGKVRAEYEKRLKDAKASKTPDTKSEREKSIKNNASKIAGSLKNFADKIEKFGSADLPEGTQKMGVDVQKKVADAIRWIAEKIENGDIRIPDIIMAAIEKFRGDGVSDDELKGHITTGLLEAGMDEKTLKSPTSRTVSIEKIKKLSESTGATDVTNEMVGNNLIKKYVDSYVGLYDAKDVLDMAHAELKKVLPDLDKDKMREAYLKQGEFKQPTKKELESGFKEAKRNFERLTSLEKDIADLTQKGELFKKTNNGKKSSPYDKEIQAKEKEKKSVMDLMGVKTSGEDKYKKASYDQRAKSHNGRVDTINSDIKNKIEKGGLSEGDTKALTKLKNQLDAAKVKIDASSAISQEKTLDGGLALLKSIKSEFQRTADDMSKMGDVNRSLQKMIDMFGSDRDASDQDVKLQRAKDKARRDIESIGRKISNEEYEDNPVVNLSKTDAELLRLQRDRGAVSQLYENRKRDYEKANKTNFRRVADFARAAMVDWMIGSPFTIAKVWASAVLRPSLETATRMTMSKVFEALPFDTTKAIVGKAMEGGESSDWQSNRKGWEAYLRQYSPKQLEELSSAANEKYEKSDAEHIAQQKEVDRVKYMGMDKPEYKEAEKKLAELKNKRDEALVSAIGNSVYQFIGGSSLKEGMEVLLHRSTVMERQFGDFDTEAWEKMKGSGREKFLTALDNTQYVMNFVGRSHAALKNFSARFSFATGFMSRLEAAVANGVDISQPDKILEIAHESYHDWERGKYQDSNWLTDAWNKATNAVDRASPELAYLMRADVAITRVPVNMLREGVMEYTLGAFRASVMAAREYYKAKDMVLQDGYTPENEAQFRTELKEQLQKMDPDKAATIIRAFRKGGFGLGLYALGLLGHAAFGGWAHKGQTAEDRKKLQREAETGEPELKTSEIQIGDWKMPEFAAKIAEHTPAFYPLGFGLGLAKVYQNNIVDGRTNAAAAENSAMAQIDHIIGSLPMIDKLALPLAKGALDNVKPTGQWDDVDQDGNPMKRKAFNISDYFKYLHVPYSQGFKKDILSERYYKAAVETQKNYREQISEIMTNTSLSKEEKEEQRKDKLKELDDAIDEIYKQNKENPQ